MLAHEGDLSGPEVSLDDSETLGPETKKPQVSLGFDMICQLLSEAGFCLAMGEEGAECSRKTQGNRRF